jgi:HEXXH motif-containing protein
MGYDFDRFPKLVFASYSDTNPMAPPGNELFESHRQKLLDAIEIIRDVDESICREIESLVSRIVVAVRNPDIQNNKGFGGASSLMVWGAIFINAGRYSTLYQVVEFLVHEVTHCVLFGFSAKTSLVQNSPHETYPSPLRKEPRPMDGVYHATMVCARIVLFTQRLLDSGRLNRSQVACAERTVSNNLAAFRDGTSVIKRYGKLSAMGHELLGNAKSLVAEHL